MVFDLAAAKYAARRVVHDTMSLEVEYYNDKKMPAPVLLRVRYHNKQQLIGDLQNDGYPMTIDGIDRVIFDVEELLAKGVVVERGVKVRVLSTLYPPDTILLVETKEKSEGPIEEIWRVVKA